MAIRNWVKGDGITHEHLNEGVDAINNNLPVTGGPGILVRSGNGGTAVSLNTNAFNAVLRVGRVVDAGPNSEANYTDPDGRYWVQFEANETDDDSYVEYGPLNIVDEVSQQPAEIIVTAHNAIDADAGSRTLLTGQIVHVVRISFDQPDSNQLTQLRWLILPGASDDVLLLFGTAIPGHPAWYFGNIMTGWVSDLDGSGEITGAACYIRNEIEIGSTGGGASPVRGMGKIHGVYNPGSGSGSGSGSGDDELTVGTLIVYGISLTYVKKDCCTPPATDSGSGST